MPLCVTSTGKAPSDWLPQTTKWRPPLIAAEGVEVLAAAVRELHVADREGRRVRCLASVERLEPQHALGRGHEAHGHAAVDPRQRDRGELELVREHGAVALEQVGDQVHARRGVGHERDLVRLRADEARDAAPGLLAPLEPGVPVEIAARLELVVEAETASRTGRGVSDVAAAFR